MDHTPLREAGLTDGEIKAYLALLELGPSTTGPIINHTSLARSIIYQILEKLMHKGLVSYIVKGKTKHYQAAEPQKLLEYVEDRQERLDKNKSRIAALLPELSLKQAMSPQSEATIYLGQRGLQTAYERQYLKLKKGDSYVYLGVPAYQPEEMHLYWRRDHERRVKAGIVCRVLFNHDVPRDVLAQRKSYWGVGVGVMPASIQTPAGIMVYKNITLIILQDPEKIAVEIVNQAIADSFSSYFEYLWKQSEIFSNKKPQH